MRRCRMFLCWQIASVLLLILITPHLQSICRCADDNAWIVHDVIVPSLDGVKWSEEGITPEPPYWITDGTWYMASIRESLINSNDIFVSTYEIFNWSRLSSFYELPYGTFYDFAENVSADPRWWLTASWRINTEWYGVPVDRTRVTYAFIEATSTAELSTWFHITHIPEHIAGEGMTPLEGWLAGFDLTPVSTGNLEIFELYKDYGGWGSSYNVYFKAPANILSQHGDNFTLKIGVSALYAGSESDVKQLIDIDMPANTEIKQMSPLNISISQGNTGTFVLSLNSTYPDSFTVVSGPPSRSFSQALWEGAGVWLLTPGGWAAIATLTLLSFTGFRGRRIWNRTKLYHRFNKGMVTVYDMYSNDLLKFHQEMDIMSKSIIRQFVEDRITDEQFEKLLHRRDDLLERMRGEPSPQTPAPG